jgi:hypothetical protein
VSGHQWESARGTIVASRVERAAAGGKSRLHQLRVFVVDARQPNGQVIRATVPSPWDASTDLSPGVTVALEVNDKTSEVRFDPQAPPPRTPAERVGFSSPEAPGPPGPPGPAGPSGPAGPVTLATPAGPGTGSAGAVPATFSSPADAFGSPGDPAVRGGLTGAVGFSSPAAPPPAFEPVSSGSPAGAGGSLGSPATKAFGDSSFSGGSFGAFRESRSDRIGRLADQRDRGQLTDEQFQARRQQIMDET